MSSEAQVLAVGDQDRYKGCHGRHDMGRLDSHSEGKADSKGSQANNSGSADKVIG
jgi:hypothetical protein